MKFPYLKRPIDPSESYCEKFCFIPCVPVKLVRGSITSPEMPALVDSGATLPFFGFQVARDIFEIDPLSGQEIPIGGIGGNDKGYLHDGFQIIVAGHSFPARICFVESLPPGLQLLGREGLFDNFRVVFNEEKKQVELRPYRE